jgi:uncharacterized membrane protein YraQ (UPF0718 family)
MYYLYLATTLILLLSFYADRQKTFLALKISYKKFINILPSFLIMLISISFVLFFIPDRIILHYLGNNNKFVSSILALLFGSLTLMPGFIAFPLCGILLKKGVSYMVLSAFSTSLMMVGLLTYPVEKEYFGVKVTIIRNLISVLIAIIIALAVGFFYGEL